MIASSASHRANEPIAHSPSIQSSSNVSYAQLETDKVCDRLKTLAHQQKEYYAEFEQACYRCKKLWKGFKVAWQEQNNERALFLLYVFIHVALTHELNHKRYDHATSSALKQHKRALSSLAKVPTYIKSLERKIRQQIEQELGNDPANVAKFEFVKREIYGDGHCFFRALCQAMHDGLLGRKIEDKKARELRDEVVRLLLEKQDEPMEETGMTLKQTVELDAPNFLSYIEGMRKSAFAGEIEALLLARSLRLRLNIYQLDKEIKYVSSYGESGAKPVYLLWQRGITEAGNHYNLLLPKSRLLKRALEV